jgi:hypothetical protein
MNTHRMVDEGGVGCGVLRACGLGAAVDDVEASDARPRTHEGILVIRRNLEVPEDSSRPAG